MSDDTYYDNMYEAADADDMRELAVAELEEWKNADNVVVFTCSGGEVIRIPAKDVLGIADSDMKSEAAVPGGVFRASVTTEKAVYCAVETPTEILMKITKEV